MLYFGNRSPKIGSINIEGTKCDYCHNVGTQKINVYGIYIHCFWIPLFPLWRKATSECTHCKRTIEKHKFPDELMQQYNEKKSRIKTPLWYWSGTFLLILLTAYIFIVLKNG